MTQEAPEMNPITDLDVVAKMASRSTIFGIACKHAKASANFGGTVVTGPVLPTSVVEREDQPNVFDVTFPIPLTTESAQDFRDAVADARTYSADPEAQVRAEAEKAKNDGAPANVAVFTVPSEEPIGYEIGNIIYERTLEV